MSVMLQELIPVALFFLKGKSWKEFLKSDEGVKLVYKCLNTDESVFFHCSMTYHTARWFHRQANCRRHEREEDQVVCAIDLWYLYQIGQITEGSMIFLDTTENQQKFFKKGIGHGDYGFDIDGKFLHRALQNKEVLLAFRGHLDLRSFTVLPPFTPPPPTAQSAPIPHQGSWCAWCGVLGVLGML